MVDENNITTLAKRMRPFIKMAAQEVIVINPGDHGLLTGLDDDDHSQYVHNTTARTITAQHSFAPNAAQAPFTLGANAQGQTITGLKADQLNKSISVSGLGLSGGGALTANRTITLASSSNPGAADSILASDASGYLNLVRLNVDILADKSGANLTIAPAGDVTFNPGGKDLLPYANYDLNIGSINKKYLMLHAAELWVETLVAQNTMATIGGRVLVAPTTTLTSDVSASQTNLIGNPGFETPGGGGADVFAGWDESWSDGNIQQDATSPHGGSYSAKITSGPSFGCWVGCYLGTTAGQGYTVSFWTRGDGTHQGRYGIYDSSPDGWLVLPTDTGVTGTTWTKVTFTFVPEVGYTTLALILYGPDFNGGYCSYDDVTWYMDTIITKHNQMAVNDIAYMEANGHIEFIKMLAGPYDFGGPGPYLYFVQRDLDGTGTNDWYAGDAVLNTGVIGDGYIDLYSMRSVRSASHIGPTIVGNIRTGTVHSDLIEAWAIGNLNGLYGYGVDTYGSAFGKYANSQSFVTIDPTNGIRMRYRDGSGVEVTRLQISAAGVLTILDSAGAAVITLDASAGAEITKKLTMPGANSAISIGSTPPTAANAGTGIWIDRTGLYSLASNILQTKIDAATGQLIAGAGAVVMDSSGINIVATGSWSTITSYSFMTSGAVHQGGIEMFQNADDCFMRTIIPEAVAKNSEVRLDSWADADHNGTITLRAQGKGKSAYLQICGDVQMVGINTGAGIQAAALDITQPLTAGAMPVLELDQDDQDQPFTNYQGTSGSGVTTSVTTKTTTATIQGHVMIKVNGTEHWMPYYSLA
jgi:hypothetical protein